MEFFRNKTSYPFMATRKRWYAVSAILIIGSLAALAIRGINFGIDFTGGVQIEATSPKPFDAGVVRADGGNSNAAAKIAVMIPRPELFDCLMTFSPVPPPRAPRRRRTGFVQ